MANRRFEQFQLSLEKKVVNLFLKVSFGSTGAPTIVKGKGICSIVRNSAGKYTITYGIPASATDPAKTDTYASLLGVQHQFLNATAPAAPGMYIVADNAASGTIQVQFNAAGTATDPGSGENVLMHLKLSNSSI